MDTEAHFEKHCSNGIYIFKKAKYGHLLYGLCKEIDSQLVSVGFSLEKFKLRTSIWRFTTLTN